MIIILLLTAIESLFQEIPLYLFLRQAFGPKMLFLTVDNVKHFSFWREAIYIKMVSSITGKYIRISAPKLPVTEFHQVVVVNSKVYVQFYPLSEKSRKDMSTVGDFNSS